MAVGKGKVKIGDHEGQTNGFGFYIPQLTAGNVADYANASATAWAAIITAVEAVTNGRVRSVGASLFTEDVDSAVVADGDAHNEIRLLLKYVDDVAGIKGRMEIPSFDAATFLQQGSETVDLTDVTIASLVNIFQTWCVSSLGNPITIYEGVKVGRNS